MATLAGRAKFAAFAWLFLGLVTPPQPFAEAERKASPNGRNDNTVPGGLHTALIAAGADPGALGLWHLHPEAAGAALAERLFQLGEDGLEFRLQRPRGVDHQ
jgi:hypothetical protein